MNTSRLAPLLIAAFASAPALASDPVFEEGMIISLGTFALDTKTTMRVDGTGGNGDEVDLEQDLGFEDQQRFRVDFDWRFAQNHKLRVMWFNNDRDAVRTLAQDVTIGDTTFLAGTSVTTALNTDIFELAYEYSFWRGEDWELTGSAGLHTLLFEYDIDGAVDTPSEADATGPLPVLGLRYQKRFAGSWYLDLQGQYFAVAIGDIDGRIDDYKAALTYRFGGHWGVGAGWNQFTVRIIGDDPGSFDGVLSWRYGGPMVFLTANF